MTIEQNKTNAGQQSFQPGIGRCHRYLTIDFQAVDRTEHSAAPPSPPPQTRHIRNSRSPTQDEDNAKSTQTDRPGSTPSARNSTRSAKRSSGEARDREAPLKQTEERRHHLWELSFKHFECFFLNNLHVINANIICCRKRRMHTWNWRIIRNKHAGWSINWRGTCQNCKSRASTGQAIRPKETNRQTAFGRPRVPRVGWGLGRSRWPDCLWRRCSGSKSPL